MVEGPWVGIATTVHVRTTRGAVRLLIAGVIVSVTTSRRNSGEKEERKVTGKNYILIFLLMFSECFPNYIELHADFLLN